MGPPPYSIVALPIRGSQLFDLHRKKDGHWLLDLGEGTTLNSEISRSRGTPLGNARLENRIHVDAC